MPLEDWDNPQGYHHVNGHETRAGERYRENLQDMRARDERGGGGGGGIPDRGSFPIWGLFGFIIFLGVIVEATKPSWLPMGVFNVVFTVLVGLVIVAAIAMFLRRFWWVALIGIMLYAGHRWWPSAEPAGSAAADPAAIAQSAPSATKPVKRRARRPSATASELPPAASDTGQAK